MTDIARIESRWTVITNALLLGFIAMAVLLHQTFVQGAGFVPEGASQLMLWVTVVGVVGYVTLRQELTVGYWLSSLTGILYVVFTGLLMAGLLGPLPADGPLLGLVLGPVAQVLFAIVLVVASYLALQERKSPGAVSEEGGQETTSAQ